MCNFLLPLWCSVRRLLLWFRATRSHTLDATGKSETGRLLLAISWSPSFNNGTTSDFLQANRKTEVNKEWLTITVRIGRIHGRASLSTDVDTLSWPGALFEGKDITIFWISLLDTGWKQNLSASEISLSGATANRGSDCECPTGTWKPRGP